jgi:hypothetical protein
MMKAIDDNHEDDDVETVVTVKNAHDPPGTYYRPSSSYASASAATSDDDSNHVDNGDDDGEENDDDGLASLSTMDTYTFRRLRDRRRQHDNNTASSHHHQYRGQGDRHRRMDEELGDGNSSLFSSSTSMREVVGWHNDNNSSRNVHRHHHPRQRQRRLPLSSSTSVNNSSSSRKNSLCSNNNRFSSQIPRTIIRELSWQHAILCLGIFGFGSVIYMTGSEIMTTTNHLNSNDNIGGVGLEMKSTDGGQFGSVGGGNGGINGEQHFIRNYNSIEEGKSEEFDDENAVLSTFDKLEDAMDNPLENQSVGSGILDNADPSMSREDSKGKNEVVINDGGGGIVQGQKESQLDKLHQQDQPISFQNVAPGDVGGQQFQQPGQQQLQTQQLLPQQPQLNQVLQAPSQLPPSLSSLQVENKTVEHESAPLSNILINQQARSSSVDEEEDGGVILANSNNTSIYYDGIANDNPRLWGVKE